MMSTATEEDDATHRTLCGAPGRGWEEARPRPQRD